MDENIYFICIRQRRMPTVRILKILTENNVMVTVHKNASVVSFLHLHMILKQSKLQCTYGLILRCCIKLYYWLIAADIRKTLIIANYSVSFFSSIVESFLKWIQYTYSIHQSLAGRWEYWVGDKILVVKVLGQELLCPQK